MAMPVSPIVNMHGVLSDLDLRDRLKVATSLALEAGKLALRMRPAPGQATLKSAQDWLTEADGAVEKLILSRLTEAFPKDGLLGEEEGAGQSGWPLWVVDPIDGTSTFARGGARWAVSIGLVSQEGTPLLGVVHAPALRDLYTAARGCGATLNGAAMIVSATQHLDRAMVEVGWSPRRPNQAHQALYASVQGAGAMARNEGSATVGLAEVAAGRLDGYVQRHVYPWDCAAALAMLEEVGARWSFPLRDDLAAGGQIFAAAPGIAEALQDLM